MARIPISTSGKTALEVAREIASQAGEILADRFYKVKEVSFKGVGDIVTDVDKESEALMRSVLDREYPEMGFLGEESLGDRADSGYVWIVDPVDGTRNYAAGIPVVSLVIGLALDGEVVVGVNYDPLLKEMFYAERGKGAFLNGEPIKVSEKTTFGECTLAADISYGGEGSLYSLDVIKKLWPELWGVRILGSSALGLSYAAAGRVDLYFHHRLSPWDQVAGMLLIEEAGGIVTDRSGKRANLYSDGLVASNRALNAEFLRKTEGMDWRMPTQRAV